MVARLDRWRLGELDLLCGRGEQGPRWDPEGLWGPLGGGLMAAWELGLGRPG